MRVDAALAPIAAAPKIAAVQETARADRTT
jgi:hypothetical protein